MGGGIPPPKRNLKLWTVHTLDHDISATRLLLKDKGALFCLPPSNFVHVDIPKSVVRVKLEWFLPSLDSLFVITNQTKLRENKELTFTAIMRTAAPNLRTV